jgi:dynein heavy chain
MNSRSSADADKFLSATTPGVGQYSIEAELDKHRGKNFGPPNGKKMTI